MAAPNYIIVNGETLVFDTTSVFPDRPFYQKNGRLFWDLPDGTYLAAEVTFDSENCIIPDEVYRVRIFELVKTGNMVSQPRSWTYFSNYDFSPGVSPTFAFDSGTGGATDDRVFSFPPRVGHPDNPAEELPALSGEEVPEEGEETPIPLTGDRYPGAPLNELSDGITAALPQPLTVDATHSHGTPAEQSGAASQAK